MVADKVGEIVRLPVIEGVSGMLGELLMVGKAVFDSDWDEVCVADTGLTEGGTVLLLLVEGVFVDERVPAAVPEPAPEPDAVPDDDPVLVPEPVFTGERGREENDLEHVLLGVSGGVSERDTTVGSAVWLRDCTDGLTVGVAPTEGVVVSGGVPLPEGVLGGVTLEDGVPEGVLEVVGVLVGDGDAR